MNNTRLTIIIVAVLAVVYVVVSSMFVVTQRQQAIVTRFGQITRVYEDPGLYFKVPTDLIESVQIIDKRLLRYDLDDITVQVSGGKFYNVDAFVTFRITDPVKFRESVLGSVQLAEQRLDTRLDAALRQVYGLRDFEAALSVQRTEMMREARDLLQADMEELGINVVDVRVLRTDLTQQVSQQTYDRMSAERLAEAARLRARGQELAQTLRAQADRQAIEIVASANRDSEIVRGRGDALRSKVFADAYSQNAEFFEFYRSLEAYRNSLEGDDTSLVLSPSSDFFTYFGKATNANNPPTPADQLKPAENLTPTLTQSETDILGEPLPPDPAGSGADPAADTDLINQLMEKNQQTVDAESPVGESQGGATVDSLSAGSAESADAVTPPASDSGDTSSGGTPSSEGAAADGDSGSTSTSQ